jgi:geranylgeranyl diphosphate synthase type II
MVEAQDGAAIAELEDARVRVDLRLDGLASRMEQEVPGRIGAALSYALRSPGKRVRPALLLGAYEACGGTDPGVDGLATAVEIVHTYSLVHDDLPCMDNDALRRGRPTTHVQFDITTATRVGYLLVPVAAEELANAAAAMDLDAATVAAIATELFEAGGIRGMVGGQWLDLEAEGRHLDLSGLMAVHRGKTGALITAAVVIGGIAAGAPPAILAALRGFGAEIGLAFQVADDVLDATGSSGVLGKTAGKDAEVAKSTYVGLLGVERAREEAARHCRAAMDLLAVAGVKPGALAPLARYIVTRSS